MSKRSATDTSQNSEIARKTKIILKTLDRAFQELKRDQAKDQCSFIQRISLNLEQNKVDHMLNNLTKGYIVKKHSEATQIPHEKFLYISEDQRFLCWKSLNKSDQKIIELRKIQTIAVAEQCLFLIRSTTKKNIQRTFVVKSENRNLEIECSKDGDAQIIAEQLQQAVRNSRRMHLSYRF